VGSNGGASTAVSAEQEMRPLSFDRAISVVRWTRALRDVMGELFVLPE
jgi:hypothetical protein